MTTETRLRQVESDKTGTTKEGSSTQRMDDRGSKLMYHARMFAFAMLAGIALFLTLVGGFVICAWLEIIHIEDR
jgi:hypothetical protein